MHLTLGEKNIWKFQSLNYTSRVIWSSLLVLSTRYLFPHAIENSFDRKLTGDILLGLPLAAGRRTWRDFRWRLR